MSVHSNLFSGPSFDALHSFFNDVDQSNFFSKPIFVPFGVDSVELQDEVDKKLIQEHSQHIIGGFLNLGSEHGWPEGHDNRLGAAFTKLILKKYYEDGKDRLGKYKPVFENALKAFSETGKLVTTPFTKEIEDAHRPKTSRVAYDCGVTGWQKHAICRMVGNLASQYGSSKPFFEILVNSQRTSMSEVNCNPFFITIHNNETDLDKRRQTLASLKQAPSIIVHSIFYSDDFLKPEEFLEKYQDKIGPNSTRILKGLAYLQSTTIKAQTVGNCWIKQPMRCLLATLYLELLSLETDLTPEETWSMAKEFYLCIQRATAIPYVESLLQKESISKEMLQSATEALEFRKSL